MFTQLITAGSIWSCKSGRLWFVEAIFLEHFRSMMMVYL